MNNVVKPFIIVLILAAAMLFYSSAYIVDETEQVVITQFGRVVGEPIAEPGLHFKLPLIQNAEFFAKNLLTWDGVPGQYPTKDKTYIWVDTFARWKISDPIRFFQALKNEQEALSRLNSIIDPAVRNLIAGYPLIESVRNTSRKLGALEYVDGASNVKQVQYKVQLGRDEITKRIVAQASDKLEQFGIKLVDVKIKRINYIEDVRRAVYGRMIAERKQIAEKFRAEGKGEASNIRGEKQKELQVIKSEAYKDAQKIKGEADARATEIYAEAYGADPDFYAFLKTMEVYRQTLKKDSTLVLSTDSDFLKYFKGVKE